MPLRIATIIPLLVLVLLTSALAVPAAAAEVVPGTEAAFVDAINASRAGHGLDPLHPNEELRDVARTWSVAMDAADILSHNPGYAEEYTGDWERMGENVGVATVPGAPSARVVEVLHEAFMDSPGHRANILGDYNQVGVGVLVDGDTTWVTVNFLDGPLPAPAEADDPAVERIETLGPPAIDEREGPDDDEGGVPPARPASPRHFMRL